LLEALLAPLAPPRLSVLLIAHLAAWSWPSQCPSRRTASARTDAPTTLGKTRPSLRQGAWTACGRGRRHVERLGESRSPWTLAPRWPLSTGPGLDRNPGPRPSNLRACLTSVHRWNLLAAAQGTRRSGDASAVPAPTASAFVWNTYAISDDRTTDGPVAAGERRSRKGGRTRNWPRERRCGARRRSGRRPPQHVPTHTTAAHDKQAAER
jgi:hypothetical protein